MDKVYRLLEWLSAEQAVNWLQDLTQTRIAYPELLQLCDSGQCAVYVSAFNLKGYYADLPVRGDGRHRLLVPTALYHAGEGARLDVQLEGPIFLEDREIDDSFFAVWDVRLPPSHMTGFFKPADIQALAAKMNGVVEDITEIEELRSQLEQERAAREQVETELLSRRAEDGNNTLEKMRLMLNHDHKEFSAMQRRAENAEMLAASKDRQLTELSERSQSNTLLIAKLTERLGQYQRLEPPIIQAETTTIGLTFPYSTKHLEAMREAAIKHWADHDRSKPAPYGIQKEVQNFLAERTGENARKVAELAAAIKPDDLPKP